MSYGPFEGPEWAAWSFPARVERVVDGDTIDVTADLGFRCRSKVRIRLRSVDTAEIYGVDMESEEYHNGKAHSGFVGEWILDARGHVSTDWPFALVTERETGKYGRWIGDLYARKTGESLTDALVETFPEVEDAG